MLPSDEERIEELTYDWSQRKIWLAAAKEQLERQYIKAALRVTKGNHSRAAKLLSIHRNTLDRKIDQYNLDHFGRKKGEQDGRSREMPQMRGTNATQV